jgi:hypothetical protein
MVRLWQVLNGIEKKDEELKIKFITMNISYYEGGIAFFDMATNLFDITFPMILSIDLFDSINYDGNYVSMVSKNYKPKPSIYLKWNYSDL